MSENYLNSDSDVIVESQSFSGLSLLGLALAIASGFSLFYPHLLPVAIIAVGVGLLVLWMAPKYQLNGLSKIIACAAIAIATTFGAWGTAHRQFQTSYDLVQAKAISETMLDAIYKKEREKSLLLMGVPEAMINAPPGDDPLAKLEETKRNYDSGPAFYEIRSRSKEPKWEFVQLDNSIPFGNEYYYKLRYRDVAQTNPTEYSITVHKNTTHDGPLSAARQRGKKTPEKSDYDVQWTVDSIESTIKLTDK